jgi:hypothetical protein
MTKSALPIDMEEVLDPTLQDALAGVDKTRASGLKP